MQFRDLSRTIFVTTTLTITPFTAALAQTAPDAIVESWVSAADGVKFLNVSHNGINYDAASGMTTITDLAISLKLDSAKSTISSGSTTATAEGKFEYTISFPAIKFANLALENGYYSAQSITTDIANLKLDINGGPGSSSSATGVYENLAVNNISWAKLPEVVDAIDKPISKYYPLINALTEISFDSASLGGMKLSQSMADQGINMLLSYGATTVGKTERGNFSNMLMAGIKMTIRAADGAAPEMAAQINSDASFGEVSITDYNYGNLVRNFAPGNVSSGNAPYETAIGNMTLNEIKANAAGGSFSLDRLAMRDVGIRAPGISVLDEADRLFQLAVTNGEKPDDKKIVALIANIYGALRLGEFEMSGLKVSAPGIAQGKMDTYRISDLSASGLGEFLLQGINFKGGRGEYFNLDMFSIADIGFPSLDALMNIEQAQRSKDIVAIMRALPTLGSYLSKGLEVRVPGQGEFSLTESRINMSDFIGPIPTKLDVAVNGLKLPVSIMEGQAKQVFSAMGFKDVIISYGLNANWDEASKVLAVNSAAWLKNGGEVKVDVAVGGVPRSLFENPLTAQQAIGLLTVNGANVKFDDQSIVDKGMAIVAAQQGSDVATLKAQAVGLLPFVLQILNNPGFVAELSGAVKTLLDTGGSIVASATPSAPVSIVQLIGVGATAPGAIIDLLNVKVVAE